MLNYLRDLYEGLLDVYRNHRDGPPPSRSLLDTPPPTTTPPAKPAAPTPAPAPSVRDTLAPLKNWAHPFGDKSNPLVQLTNLSKAVAGYYPVGRSGLWHGGVHFDGGTAGILKQDHVRCIADGEVVAYRIAAQTPVTTYYTAADKLVQAPFASGFVLVRHHLQAPKLEDSPDSPPSLIFYSLYMHLQDWKTYEDDPKLARPVFWRVGTYRVKSDVADREPLGANVYASQKSKTVLAVLPRGTPVTINLAGASGGLVKLKSAQGIDLPALDAKSGVLGYVQLSLLEPIGGAYRVRLDALGAGKGKQLNVHAAASAESPVVAALPRGAEVVISGEGDYRKLETIVPRDMEAESGADDYQTPQGYLRFTALEAVLAPERVDSVVIPAQPIPIKAGELIGHLGPYQTSKLAPPVYKLHLETFTADNLPKFFEASRAWADRLPVKEKTWLKLEKGTGVITGTGGPPSVMQVGTPSGYPLLVPRSLLDGLGAADKRAVAGEAFNWYRLTGLLHDTQDKPLDGWVCERVGTTPWVSPWHWDGYEIINDYGPLASSLAYNFNARGLLTDEEVERLRPHIDAWDQGPLQTRLYDIVDTDHKDGMSPDEMRAALAIPAKAQLLSQLVINYESEWHYRQQKWDDLDDVQGHTPSTPFLNWMAEKERIRELKWWSDVAGRVGLPESGRVYHLHPIGLKVNFIHSSIEVLIQRIGNIISHGEGGYESYNTGTKDVPHGRVGYSFMNPAVGTVTGKTINQIIETDSLSGTDRNRMFATGKYQTIISTLRKAKEVMDLSGDEKYDADMQEQVFSEYLLDKAGSGGLGAFVRKRKGTIDDAQLAAAQEWASIAAPTGRRISDGRISDGSLSYYESSANHANTDSTRMLRDILIEVRAAW